MTFLKTCNTNQGATYEIERKLANINFMASLKRIAYLVPLTELAGGERVIFDLCTNLNKEKYKPYVIMPRYGGLAKRMESKGVQVAIVPFRRDFVAGYPPAVNLSAIRKITKILSAWKIDLLHLNDSYLTLMGGLIGRNLEIPVTLTAHGIWDTHFVLQDILNCFLIKKIWAPTEQIGKALKRRHIIPPHLIRVIPFGVDVSKFSANGVGYARKELGISKDTIVITRIARFDSVKDYPTFLTAAELLVSQYENIRFLVLGDNLLNIPSESNKNKMFFFDYLEKCPKLKKRVQYLGYQEDVAYFLAATDILISSSRSESFGLNILEAMAMGCPVISTNQGGPREIIIDGETGILVPPGDPHALSDAVMDLIKNADKRRQMGRKGCQRASKYFNLKSYIKSMQNQYHELFKDQTG